MDSASYPGHTVDDATVEPGAAPVLTFDQDRPGVEGEWNGAMRRER